MDTSTDTRVYGMFVLSYYSPSFFSFSFLLFVFLFQSRCQAGCMTGHERYSGHLSVLHFILYLSCRGMSPRIHEYSFLSWTSDQILFIDHPGRVHENPL